MRARKSQRCLPVTYTKSTNMAAKEGIDVLDLHMFNTDTERGSTFWNSSLVEMKFSTEKRWIKAVRGAKNKPNYGMTNMDSLLEEVVGNKLELVGPLLDSYLKEMVKAVLSKLSRSKATGLVTPVALFIPWPVFRHLLTLARGYSGEVKSSKDGLRHCIEITTRNSLMKLFSPSRFSGENFIALRHFKKMPSKSGNKTVSMFSGRVVVALTANTPFKMDYSMKSERVTVTFYVQRYTADDLAIDTSLQAIMNKTK